MNCAVEDEPTSFYRNAVNDSESSENFQKFIKDVFEKNGILNDLRAYLRGHIVDVLKSAETGASPALQKHFTQRLELGHQAINMLVTEYLLRMEFSYSLSVFLSEIPLANMVFEFARNLLQTSGTDALGLKFNENDVWSILHCIGVKCDAVHVTKIMESYKLGISPLLNCILKHMPMNNKEPSSLLDGGLTSDECLSSSTKSTESLDDKPSKPQRSTTPKCGHYVFCKSCRHKLLRLRRKYKKRKLKMEKNNMSPSMNSPTFQSLMNNINATEKDLIDEMFQQIKTVYETEVSMIKEEEDRKIQRSVANHALQLQKHRDEMESSFKIREAELEMNVHQKKKFLWGLARALRSQHRHMALAMRDVQREAKRLAEKESSLKTQMEKAEEMLKKRGEEMRTQISQELIILEGRLGTMKSERDNINRERDELERLKNTYESYNKSVEKHDSNESVDLKTHYNVLKGEMAALRGYIESTKLQQRCVTERGTVMDLGDGVMNNSVGVRGDDDGDDRLKVTQVINDLKKQKRVNFSQSNLDDVYRRHVRASDPDCGSDELNRAASNPGHDNRRGCAGCHRDAMVQLREENDRLKTFASQQREHINALSRERDRLQTHLVNNARPRTAPALLGRNYISTPRGAGEELSTYCSGGSRVLTPGEVLPFIGVLRDRRSDTRRHALSQWRALQQRSLRSPQHYTDNMPMNTITPQVLNITDRQDGIFPQSSEKPQRLPSIVEKQKEKRPNSVLREEKQNLKSSNVAVDQPPPRDKGPSAVLREAKLRLRKLEIEAEAVGKSYLDFRRRQSELREEREKLVAAEQSMVNSVKQLEMKPSKTLQRHNNAAENITTNTTDTLNNKNATENLKKDFDKYLREYQTKFDIGPMHFPNKNSSIQRTKPIPETFSINYNEDTKVKNTNYLETSLTEFRKFYHTDNTKERNVNFHTKSLISTQTKQPESGKVSESTIETNRLEINRNLINKKQIEHEILKETIDKIYNVPETSTPNDTNLNDLDTKDLNDEKSDKIEDLEENIVIEENRLVLQVENIRETNIFGVTESNQDILLVVESPSVNKDSDNDNAEQNISTQMTIILSPKQDNRQTKEIESSKETSKIIDNNDLNANNDKLSANTQIELTQEKIESDIEKDVQDDYLDDFTADVDNYINYNSTSDGGQHSPISLAKTSDDENFWDN